jgi:hypothetical protein
MKKLKAPAPDDVDQREAGSNSPPSLPRDVAQSFEIEYARLYQIENTLLRQGETGERKVPIRRNVITLLRSAVHIICCRVPIIWSSVHLLDDA